MAYDRDLADTLLSAIGIRPGISEVRMFGGLGIMLNGHMLCGVIGERAMFRVGKERMEEALARPGASPMDFTGKPLSGFIYVDPTDCDEAALADWIDYASVYVDALPPKKPKKKKPVK